MKQHDRAGSRPRGAVKLPPSDLGAIVASIGSIRAVARELGMPEATLRSYVTGRTSAPEGIATAVEKLGWVGWGQPGNPALLALRDRWLKREG